MKGARLMQCHLTPLGWSEFVYQPGCDVMFSHFKCDRAKKFTQACVCLNDSIGVYSSHYVLSFISAL